MRFVVDAHKVSRSPFKRWASTEDEAIVIAVEATKRWLKEHPNSPRSNVAGVDQPETAVAVAPSKAVLQPFATTRFDCVHANPVAQVWLCTSNPGEKKAVGRKKASGQPAEQTQVPHEKGACAILVGKEPLRNPDGSVRVYVNRFVAEEDADTVYATTDEDETISWKSPSSRVAASLNFEVHFNPEAYGVTHPFIIWFPRANRAVYVDTERATATRPGVSLKNIESPQMRLDLEAARARARAEDRQPAFEERAKTFRSIWEAVAEMERRERMLRGETVR